MANPDPATTDWVPIWNPVSEGPEGPEGPQGPQGPPGLPGATAPHHANHEPGGSDALVNAAWTNQFNIFTADQRIRTGVSPALLLEDSTQAANSKLFRMISAGGSLYLQSVTDDLGVQQGAAILDRAGNIQFTGNVRERRNTRTHPMGYWQDVPFNAANYTSNAGSWVVGSASNIQSRYTLIGLTMIWSIYLSWFSGQNTVSGAPTVLSITIPGGFTCQPNSQLPVTRAFDSGGTEVSVIAAPGTSNYIDLIKLNSASFGNGAFGLISTFTLEIIGSALDRDNDNPIITPL